MCSRGQQNRKRSVARASARLAQYASARNAVVAPGDGWLSLDDDQEWDAMLFGRWPVLGEDLVRGPPDGEVNGITGVA
jgi:hypothetical protein